MRRFLYELSEGWKIAASQMRSNLMRSALTALGVIIGIVAVTLMGTAIGGIQVGFDKSMSIFGDDVLYVGQWPWRKVDDWWNYRDRKKIKTEYADALNRIIAMTLNSNLMIAIPTSSVIRSVKYADSEVGNVLVRGTVSDYIITSTFDFKEGRFFNDLESRGGANVCVVGYDVADALFPSASPIDKSVLINGQPFKIVGVIARQGSFLGLFSLDSIVVMPRPAFQKYFTAKSEADILVKVKDKTKLAEAKDELDGLMRRVRGLPPEKNDDFSINEQQALKSTLDPIKNSIAIAGLFITGLSLFVGAIGIMNITFVSVKERTKEIGTRKALGARRRTVLLQFLIESTALCLLGGFIGITIAVFSIISVMTAIGALQNSIENGLSFLGSNIFQFAKYPANVNIGGEIKKKYQNRRNISYRQALHYYQLMEGDAREICLKCFGYELKGQAVYNGVKTTPSLLIVGTNRSFLTANAYTLGYGRNLNDEDVNLARRVIVVGKIIEKRLFPHESPIGKVIRVSGHTYTIIGVLAEKGTSFGQSQDDLCIMPITRFFEDYGEAKRTVNIATQAFTQDTYNRTFDRGIDAMRIARGLRPDQPNDFEIYSNDSLKSAFVSVAGYVRVGAFVISFIALVAAGIGIMNIMLVSVTERTKEIGVRKSIGARSRDILRQFLTEAVFISEAGGVLGIILGIIVGDLLAAWLKMDLIFPYGWAIAGLLVCSAIGIGFGLYPAYRAANLDPIEALRYE